MTPPHDPPDSLTVRVDRLEADVRALYEAHHRLRNSVHAEMLKVAVLEEHLKTMRLTIYGLIGIILAAVVSALVAGVIRSPGGAP